MKITFLGTGTSQGVPVIGCRCKVCTSEDYKDKRLRTSILLTIDEFNILIDVGPDFRQQMLTNNIGHLNAILLTHEHNDHIIGIDDIRPFNFRQKYSMPIYAQKRVIDDLRLKFHYIFTEKPYPGAPKIIFHPIDINEEITILENIKIQTLEVMHGSLPILGFRIENFAYITDASFLPENSMIQLKNLDILVLNCLQYRKHYSHYTYEEAVNVAQKIQAKSTYFIHMSHEMGLHEELLKLFPENIFPAHDGLQLIT